MWKVLKNNLTKSDLLSLSGLLVALLVTYLPLLLEFNTKTFGNDMGSNWVYTDYMKRSFNEFGQFPLWFTGFLSGFPLDTSNLAGIFYPPHWLFFFAPLKLSFNILTLVHVFLIGIAGYLLAKVIFKQSSFPSFLASLALMLSPKIMNHNNLGHFNLVESIPLILFALFFLLLGIRLRSYYLAAISGVFLALTTLVFSIFYVYALFAIGFYTLVILVRINFKGLNLRDSGLLLLYPVVAVLASLLLSAVFLLPFLEFSSLSLRARLGFWEGAFPSIFRESLAQLFYVFPDRIHNGETLLYLGIPTFLLAVLGFFTNIKNKYVWFLVVLGVFALSVSFGANEVFYKIYYKLIPVFHFMRAPVRIWILVIISVSLLSSYGVSYLASKLPRVRLSLYTILTLLVFLSLYVYNQDYFHLVDYEKKDISLLQGLDQDYRIYCLDNCLAVPEAIPEGYQFSNGGEVVMLKDYSEFMQQAAGYRFDGYSISVPPYQIFGEGDYHQEQAINPTLLGLTNTKYIVSHQKLEDPNLVLIKQAKDYLIYENLKVLPQAYTTSEIEGVDIVEKDIDYYSPNKINLNFQSTSDEYLVLSDLYYPGWKAYDNGEEVKVEKVHDVLRAIKLSPGIHKITFEYFPDKLKVGLVVTLVSLLGVFIYPFLLKKKRQVN